MRPFKSRFVILSFVFVVLFSGCSETKTTYYNPVLSPDGEQIAYLKRVTRYRYKSGLGFFGGSYDFSKDTLHLCISSRSDREENCIDKWDLPLEKLTTSTTGTIRGRLVWVGQNLLYEISLRDWATKGQEPGQGGIAETNIITNVATGQGFPEIDITSHLTVRVEPDPLKYAFPIDNKIIVEERTDASLPNPRMQRVP